MKFSEDTQQFIYNIHIACADIEFEIEKLKNLQTRLKKLVVSVEEYEQRVKDEKIKFGRFD